MNFTPYQHFSYNESLPQRISQSEGLSHVNDTEPQSWLRAPQALPDNLIDPNLVASSFPPASNTYEFFSDQKEGHVAEGKIYHHGDQEQDTDYFVNDPSQQQPYQPIIGEEMDGQIYHGAPSPYYMAPTANGVERFRWNPNGSPASHQVEAFPLRGLKDIDSVGLGALFPQDDQVLQQSVDDADLGNLGHGPPGLYHTQSSPQLSFRKDEDYSFTTSYNNDGTRKSLSVPGPRSARTSDASVDGGRYPCREGGCHKTYKNPNGLMRHERSHKPGFQALRKYRCDVCEHPFQYPKDLSRHERKHDAVPVKDFKCTFDTCRYYSEGFGRKDHLQRHVRKCH
ncbi:hypothetical protein BLS_009609 [Venturia inaequalis]|uniref:C2H2-type domain-containing protein n=1 Tax=Venturia inaequalis TaxID=5025 RepID=A0A8H3U4A9_VENIN|nr:hypothetical protein BLS_009609 [Venturia inaequalis]